MAFAPEQDTPSAPALSVAAILTGTPLAGEGLVRVQAFTDPLSAWCWGNEPVLLRLTERFGAQLQVELRMVGLLHGGDGADSPGFQRPDRIAMQWEEASHFTGMPVDSEPWLTRPPGSSWPACAAVKAAQAQDPGTAERYLRRLREAAVFEAEDVESPETLDRLAREAGVDADRLGDDLASGAAADALSRDLALAAGLGGIAAPALFLTGPAGRAEIRGAQPWPEVEAAVRRVCGDACRAVPLEALPDRQAWIEGVSQARGSITAAEAAEVLGMDRRDATDLLDRMAAGGRLRRVARPVGSLYRPVG